MSDDVSRSVQVEVDGASTPMPEVPELGETPSGPSRLPIALVVLLVVAVGVALVVLSPDTGQTADGSERSVPSTAVPEAVTSRDAIGADSSDAERAAVAEVFDESSPLLVPADAPFGMRQVVRTDDGFLGLTQIRDGEGPVYSSTNGVDWEPISPRFQGTGLPNLDGLFWTGLREAQGGFVLTSTSQVFVSGDATTWTRLGLVALRSTGANPFLAFENIVIGAADGEVQPIDELLREHTDIEVGDPGVCSLLLSPAASPGLEVLLCESSGRARLNESNASGTAPVGDVISCALSLAPDSADFPRFFNRAVSLWAVDADGNGPTRLGGPDSTWNLASGVVPISGRRLAFVDEGFSSDGSCEGLIDLPPDRPPAVIVLDLATGVEQRADLPGVFVGLDDVVVLGEVGTATPPHLLIDVAQSPSTLDIARAVWTARDPGALRLAQPDSITGGSNAVSVTGQRSYRLDNDGLQVRRFATTGARIFTEEQRLIEIREDDQAGEVVFPLSDLDDAEIIYADDSVVFFHDSVGRLWRINVNADPG